MDLHDIETELLHIHEKSNRPAEGLFVGLIFAPSVLLLTQIGTHTKVLNGKSLLQQPGLWPGIFLAGMILFGALTLLKIWHKRRAGDGAAILPELAQWIITAEYPIWFLTYASATPYFGYLPTTLLFCAILSFRAGYRSGKGIFWAVLTGFCTVLLFKTILHVRIPGGLVYEYLPPSLRNFMIIYW